MCRSSEFPPYPAYNPSIDDICLHDGIEDCSSCPKAIKLDDDLGDLPPNIDLMDVDVWGKHIVSQFDGHSAWSCNDRECEIHPVSLYEALKSWT